MTCENNKKGCNNKFLISTLMLVSMVCMLSVSDMLGMEPQVTQIDPYEAMEKINKNPNYYKEFYKIFEGREDLIKRNCCCCGDIDIKRTVFPRDSKSARALFLCTISDYIYNRFKLKNNNATIADDWNDLYATCEPLDDIIRKIYKAPST